VEITIERRGVGLQAILLKALLSVVWAPSPQSGVMMTMPPTISQR